MKRRAGNRDTSAEKSGLQISVSTRVPAKSQGSFDTPDAAATASRIGRMTNQLLSTQKKNANDTSADATSSSRTSTVRRSSGPIRVPVILGVAKDDPHC